jgi:hypothetical protein
LLAYEGFNYPDAIGTSVVGLNGGSGWLGAYTISAGAGFLWSQPSASSATVVHENEFGLEATYVLQLTPMAKLQSDFQAIWDPAYNPGASHAFVFQLQLTFAW